MSTSAHTTENNQTTFASPSAPSVPTTKTSSQVPPTPTDRLNSWLAEQPPQPLFLATAAAARSVGGVPTADAELENKVKKACERISENLHICANEPSLAFYRLAEHVRKALPPTVESRRDVRRQQQQLREAYGDAEDGLAVVAAMEGASKAPLANSLELLKAAVFLQQQNKLQQQRSSRDPPSSSSSSSSMYQRFSAHISSVDIPDFSELKETARETASLVESALSRGSDRSLNSLGGGSNKAATAATPIARTVSVADGADKSAAASKAIISRSKSVTVTAAPLQK